MPTLLDSILVSVPPVVEISAMDSAIAEIRRACAAEDVDGLMRLIVELVPEYQPASVLESQHQEKTRVHGATVLSTSSSVI